jgi:hypothetical protein
MTNTSKGWEDWFEHLIELEGIYFVYYPDEKPQFSKKEQKEFEKYTYIMQLPDTLRYKFLAEMPVQMDPNVLKVKGRVLIEYSERGYIPIFDAFFDNTSITKWCRNNWHLVRKFGRPKETRRLTFMPVEGYEFYREWSRQLRRRKRR